MNDVNNIGIIGSGTMGNGIAHVFALSGYKVMLVDINESILNQSINIISTNMERQMSKDIITQSDMHRALDSISINTNVHALSESDLVVEAVSEKESIKLKIF